MTSWKVWLHGLAAALISAFFSAVAGTLALPTVFAFDTRNGWANLIKIATPSAILAVALYLKNSPIPSLTLTTDTETPTTSTKSTLTVTPKN